VTHNGKVKEDKGESPLDERLRLAALALALGTATRHVGGSIDEVQELVKLSYDSPVAQYGKKKD
jgi:hypothetical protein